MGDLRKVSLNTIRENKVALRAVNRQSEEYRGLVDSIKNKGFLGAISVRPRKDPETEQEYYELVDGLHRFSAARDAGLEEINVDVVNLSDDEVLETQIMANIHKVETRPVEYSHQLRRILARRPLMTEAELADSLGKSTQWIQQRLGLTKITNPEIQTLVNEGKIKLANAYALAKLPPEEMPNFVDRAMTEAPDKFVPQVNKRAKEIREAKRQGRDPNAVEFSPQPHLQKVRDVKQEFENGELAQALCAKHQLTTAVDGFRMGIAWVLNMDPDSVERQKAADAERKAARAEANKAKKAERAKKKAEAAQAKAKEAAEEAAKAEAAVANS